jgi:hypothetical protein
MGTAMHLPQSPQSGTARIRGSRSSSTCIKLNTLHPQVDECVHTLVLGLPSRPDAANAWVQQLATSKLRPKKLVFGGNTKYYNMSMLTSPETVEVWRGVNAVEARHALPGGIAIVGMNCAELVCW